MNKISAKHALSRQELDFCRVYLAFGSKDMTEAYRRSFMVLRADGECVQPPRDDMTHDQLMALEVPTTKEVSRRARQLLDEEYIQRHMLETARPPGDTARAILAEQALFSDETASRRAAEEILKQEDKLGFKDGFDRWCELLRQAGAEIEVPLPTRFQKTFAVICSCGKENQIEIDEPLVARVPFREMFPDAS